MTTNNQATFISEESVGVQLFVDPTIPPFSGIIKHRFSDFIVNEVDMADEAVHLTNFDIPQPDPKLAADREAELLIKEQKEQESNAKDDDEKLLGLLEVLDNDQETIDQVKKMLDSYGNDVELVNLKPQADKNKRTAIHKFVKDNFARRMVSETADGTMRLRMHKKTDDFDRRSKQTFDPWKLVGGEFCRFCIYKENRETMEGIYTLTSMLRVPNKVFSIAGTKDRRGITCQWATAHKVKAERLLALNKGLRNMKLGNFSYVSKGLQLGDLNGNRFIITLRNVLADSEDTIHRAMTSLRDHGFINYFGMQRFGSGAVGTHQIGRALLQGDWGQAVDLIMKPRVGESPDFYEARKEWDEKRNAKASLLKFPKRWIAETQILWSFQKAGHDRNKMEAIGNIPRNLRLMYVHAYQSLVWNHMVSERIRIYGREKPVVGDLVAVDRNALEKASALEDAAAAAEEDKNDKKNNNRNNKASSSSSSASKGDHALAKVLTAEDVDNYTIYDVILPLPGFDVLYPTHEIGAQYRSFMAKDNLNPDDMRRPHQHFALSGSYRTILSKPRNVEWQVVRYDNAELPLTFTDLEILEGKNKTVGEDGQEKSVEPEGIKTDGQHMGLILHLTLQSSQYATMAIREVCKQDTTPTFQTNLSNDVEGSSSSTATPTTSSIVPSGAATPEKRSVEEVDGRSEEPSTKK